MAIPNGVIYIKSVYSTEPGMPQNPWIKIQQSQYSSRQLVAATNDKNEANRFLAVPLGGENTLALFDLKSECWVSRINLGTTDFLAASKPSLDVFCQFTYEETNNGSFRLKCSDASYVAVTGGTVSNGNPLEWLNNLQTNDDTTLFGYEMA
mgnify:CR=1 FL=1